MCPVAGSKASRPSPVGIQAFPRRDPEASGAVLTAVLYVVAAETRGIVRVMMEPDGASEAGIEPREPMPSRQPQHPALIFVDVSNPWRCSTKYGSRRDLGSRLAWTEQ
jgi:hypothetical protein